MLDETAASPSEAQGKKMETMGRLVGGVAHDFANLLTLIAGYSDIVLSRMSQSEPLRVELDEIRKAANRGSRLTAQLLGFTRDESVRPTALDLNAVVNDMRRMLEPIIGEYLELSTELSPGLHRVMADPGQMEQVVMNLILNARDAMPQGGRIVISTSNCELDSETALLHEMEHGAAVLLSVRDNGRGIAEELLPRLWEPFFTTKEKGKGTGLGLSTVRKIVKDSRGDVWVRSAPGQGATFTVCLPAILQPAERPENASSLAPVPAGNETVLLVEDEDSVRRLLTQVLTRRGYNVIEASNGEEASRIFEERGAAIDLVLTDMVMPRMTGRELAERVLQIRPDAKVIFMSGYTDDVLVRTGALRPGMSFLQKPLRAEVLASKVREALDAPLHAA